VPKKSYPLFKVHSLLEPGPVALLTTACAGRANAMAMSWHIMLEFEPPLVACVVSNGDYSFSLLKASKECVINIPTVDIAEAVVRCGNVAGEKIDKFEKFGLTRKPAKLVAAPLVEERYASLECRAVDTRMVPRYGLFFIEVVCAWSDPTAKNLRTIHHIGHGSFRVAGETIKLRSKMK
jgi:flavin reductase (DIM6/NTAB) family NADH-FMN oxidoreductase RutF